MYYNYSNDDRQFFVPFLFGGLAGSAIVGFSRPRPVYVNQPYNAYPYRPYPYYGNSFYYSQGGYY